MSPSIIRRSCLGAKARGWTQIGFRAPGISRGIAVSFGCNFMELIDGNKIAAAIIAELKSGIGALHGRKPCLALIRVGDDPASVSYVRKKEQTAAEIGISSRLHLLPDGTTQSELAGLVERLNADPEIDGILVQSPLPKPLDERSIFCAISPSKDVDGFHPLNVGKLALGDETGFAPCTPAGVHQLLIRSGVKIEGAHVVVLGRSRIVGRPVSLILSHKAPNANATVTVAHSRSRDLAGICHSANILVAAIGVPFFVKANMVRDGAVVIDVGINRIEDKTAEKGYRLVGDVDFAPVSHKASLITPVPGGVGPMTIAMLMHNTLRAAGIE